MVFQVFFKFLCKIEVIKRPDCPLCDVDDVTPGSSAVF